MTTELFQQVRRKLNITWEDEDTTARVKEIIESAIPTMIHRLGIADPDFDFSKPGDENTLFKNYCLYEYNHCANEFWQNYSFRVAETRAKHIVSHYKNAEGADFDE